MSFLSETFFMESTSDNVKELNIIMEQSNIDFMKIDQMFAMVESQREINLKASELKVATESGTMEDLEMLYEAANAEADGKKKGIVRSAIEAVQNFFGRIIEFINEKILKRATPDKVRVSKGALAKCDAIEKADGEVRGAIAKLKSGQMPDIAKVTAAIGAIAAVSATGYVIISKTDFRSRISKLKQKASNITSDVNKLKNDSNAEKAGNPFWSMLKSFGDVIMSIIKKIEQSVFKKGEVEDEGAESFTDADGYADVKDETSEGRKKANDQKKAGSMAKTLIQNEYGKLNNMTSQDFYDDEDEIDEANGEAKAKYRDQQSAERMANRLKANKYDEENKKTSRDFSDDNYEEKAKLRSEDVFGADYMYESAMSELEQMIDAL